MNKSNIQKQMEEAEERLEELRLKYPEKRKEALKELEEILERLKEVKEDLSDFQQKWFLDENKISGIGMAGRAVDMMDVIQRLNMRIKKIEEIMESLGLGLEEKGE